MERREGLKLGRARGQRRDKGEGYREVERGGETKEEVKPHTRVARTATHEMRMP